MCTVLSISLSLLHSRLRDAGSLGSDLPQPAEGGQG